MRAFGVLLGMALAAGAAAAEVPDITVSQAVSEWFAEGVTAQPAGFLNGPEIGNDWEEDDWDWVDGAGDGGVSDGRKSLLTAVAASALLPGLGERYVGRARRATMFHLTEGAIWATFTGYRIQGSLRRDRYQEFAQIEGGANRDGDAEYFEHIGLWLSLEEWHDIVRRDARLRFPDDPEARQEFFDTNQRYAEGQNWVWPDDETRVRYRQLRSRSERSFRNGRLAVGLAIVNRLASMVDALALARRHNRSIEEEARLEFRISPRQTAEGLILGPVLTARY